MNEIGLDSERMRAEGPVVPLHGPDLQHPIDPPCAAQRSKHIEYDELRLMGQVGSDVVGLVSCLRQK